MKVTDMNNAVVAIVHVLIGIFQACLDSKYQYLQVD